MSCPSAFQARSAHLPTAHVRLPRLCARTIPEGLLPPRAVVCGCPGEHRARKEPQEGAHPEVVVAGEEDVRLRGAANPSARIILACAADIDMPRVRQQQDWMRGQWWARLVRVPLAKRSQPLDHTPRVCMCRGQR